MLDRFARLARTLQPLRPLFLGGAIVPPLLFVVLLLAGSPALQQRWLLPLWVIFIWALSGWSFITNFISVPGAHDPRSGVLHGLKHRFVRVGYWLLVILFSITTLTVVLLSYRLLSVWWGLSTP